MCFILLFIEYCGCQQVDPGIGMDHRDLGPFRDRIVIEMVSEHMLTVGRDLRNGKAIGQNYIWKTFYFFVVLVFLFTQI